MKHLGERVLKILSGMYQRGLLDYYQEITPGRSYQLRFNGMGTRGYDITTEDGCVVLFRDLQDILLDESGEAAPRLAGVALDLQDLLNDVHATTLRESSQHFTCRECDVPASKVDIDGSMYCMRHAGTKGIAPLMVHGVANTITASRVNRALFTAKCCGVIYRFEHIPAESYWFVRFMNRDMQPDAKDLHGARDCAIFLEEIIHTVFLRDNPQGPAWQELLEAMNALAQRLEEL